MNNTTASSMEGYLPRKSLFQSSKNRIVSSQATYMNRGAPPSHDLPLLPQQLSSTRDPKAGRIGVRSTTNPILTSQCERSPVKQSGMRQSGMVRASDYFLPANSTYRHPVPIPQEPTNQEPIMTPPMQPSPQPTPLGRSTEPVPTTEDFKNSHIRIVVNDNPPLNEKQEEEKDLLYLPEETAGPMVKSTYSRDMSASHLPQANEQQVPKPFEEYQPAVMTSKKNNPYLSSEIITSSQRLERERPHTRPLQHTATQRKQPQNQPYVTIEIPKQSLVYASNQHKKEVEKSVPKSPAKSTARSKAKEAPTEHFANSRKDLELYLGSVLERLRQSQKEMGLTETLINRTIDEKLGEECNQIRTRLLRQIDIALGEFKQRAKWQLSQNRVDYMADFEEINCQLDLRLQQTSHYIEQLRGDHRWKSVLVQVAHPAFEENISFVVGKAEEVQAQSKYNVTSHLINFSDQIHLCAAQQGEDLLYNAVASIFQRLWRSPRKQSKKTTPTPLPPVVTEPSLLQRWS